MDETHAPPPAVVTRACRCGCGVGVVAPRVFLNKAHQIAWLRAEGSKRRSQKARPDHPAPAPVDQPVLPVLEQVSAAPMADADSPANQPVAGVFDTLRDRLREPEAADATPDHLAADVSAEPELPASTDDEESLSLVGEIYVVGFAATALPVFVVTWLLCMAAFGLPLGGGLGWIPALVAAASAGAVWPVGLLAGAAAAVFVLT